MPQHTELRILGPFEIAVASVPVPLGSAKQRVLLARLAAELNRPVPLDHLVSALWGDTPPATWETTLRSLVSRLRRFLAGLPAVDGQPPVELAAQEGAYVLRADPAALDAQRFADDADAGAQGLAGGDPLEAVRCFSAGLGRWRAAALPELADVDHAHYEGTRLDEARVAAMESLADAYLAMAEPGRAQATLEVVVADHPLREGAWGRLMVAFYRQGRQADALRVYQRARRLLVEELGVEPGPELRKLEQQVLAQSAELDGPAAPAHNTVAFLFTDIEASTQRWEGDRQGMASDLARHDDLLRAEVERAGGRVFAHTGDGLCASFPTAGAAVAAAVGGQRALQAQQWRGPAPLRVRMAVHAGAAEARGENWVGPPLNRAARLLALAEGGQILCSRAAADLAGDDLPPGVRLSDLGEHRLADLARPEQVFGVAHPDLGVCPALTPQTGRPTNLPEPVTSFLGRARELDELETLLASARILTLTGVGGAGKTRLAIELARRSTARYADGAWLVELASVRDPAAVADEVGMALGLMGGAGQGEQAVARLREWLAARRLLLVMDNCEHLVEDVAALLEALLPAAPGLSVLATSREVLALPGEVSWSVPPLSLPAEAPAGAADLAGSDAVELFCERARRAQPAFALGDANAAAVAKICRRLDGIPLALELAASRIRVLGAHQLAERLDDRFRVLAATARGAPARHQTLQATMDWSWDLLPAREREALRRLSVFPAGFDLEAAEAVVAGTEATEDPSNRAAVDGAELVLRLVDKSLVAAGPEAPQMRYHLLETVRSYAAARLVDAGEDGAARRAHCDHFLELADRAVASGWAQEEQWCMAVAVNEASLRSAIDWCLAGGRRTDALRLMAAYWTYVSWTDRADGHSLLERCLVDPLPAPSRALVECLCARSILNRGADDSEARLLSALEMARGLGDPDGVARAKFSLGYLLVQQGRHDEGRQVLLSGRDYFAAAGRTDATAWYDLTLGWRAMVLGDHAGASSHFAAALTDADRLMAVHVLGGLALAEAAVGNHDEARSHAARAVSLARGIPMDGFLLMALCRATEAAGLIGDDAMGIEALDELLVTLRRVGSQIWVSGTLEAALALLPSGDADQAAVEARLLGAAAEIRTRLREVGVAVVGDRLEKRRAEIEALLGPQRLDTETERGRQASIDEALRWALTLLRSDDHP